MDLYQSPLLNDSRQHILTDTNPMKNKRDIKQLMFALGFTDIEQTKRFIQNNSKQKINEIIRKREEMPEDFNDS